jgi:hypothetical protein
MSICARADDVLGVRVEDAAGDQVQRILAMFVDDGMTGIVTALKTDDHIRLLSQIIDDPPLSFIAPLGADDCCNRHHAPALSCYSKSLDWRYVSE